MKKSLCIFILAAAAGLCAILFAIQAVDSGKGNITVTETVLEGDVSAAEGISVEIGTHWEEHLLWNTEYQPGRVQEAASSFDFSGQGIKWGYSNPRAWSSSFTSSGEVGSYRNRSTAYVDMDVIPTGFGTGRVGAATGNSYVTYSDVRIENLPWSRLLQAAVDQTAADETNTVTLRVRDFYDYYPLTFSVIDRDSRSYYESFWNDYATEYFKLMIPEDEKLQVTIRKDHEGKVLELSCSSIGEGYYPVEISVIGETGYYFAFYLEGNNKDYEEMEFAGQYAVYWLPFAEKSGKTPKVDIEQMEISAQLPEGAIPVTMQLDEDEQILYLLALQKEKYILLTYLVKDGELALIRQLTAYDTAFAIEADADNGLSAESGQNHLYFRKMTVQEDGILLTWQDNHFAFITRDGYQLWCTGIFPKSAKGEEDEDLKTCLAPGAYLASESTFPYEHTFAFDGTRLALAAFEGWDSLDSRLLVYREGQLVYSGYYQYSGELDEALGMNDRILPWGDNFGGRRRDGSMFTVLNPLRVSIRSNATQ